MIKESFLDYFWGTILVIVIIFILSIAIWAGIRRTDQCKSRGGHFLDTSSVGFGTKGPVFVPSELCVKDGRILE